MSWIIALFAGAVGGFIGGIALSKYSMGTAYNMIAGLVGGGIGGMPGCWAARSPRSPGATS